MTAEARIRKLTIQAQLHREFADRLNLEADAWQAEARGKRRKAIEHLLEANKLTVAAGELRGPAGKRPAGERGNG